MSRSRLGILTAMTRTLTGATRGLIAGTALFVGIVSGGLWTTDTQSVASGTVFAGRAGVLPGNPPDANGPDSQEVRRVVGTTGTGCVLGLASGGPAGALYGCLGGLSSNIPW